MSRTKSLSPGSLHPALPPLLLAVLALVVRLRFSGFERTVWGDEPFYLWLGRNWLGGQGYSFAYTGRWDYHHTPGYPLITAVLTWFSGDMQRASEWSYILFGVLLALAVYALARRIYGWRSALAAGIVVALAPATALMPLYWGTMTEPPYQALALAGVWFAHRAYHQPRALDVALAALMFALAYYVRPEAVVYLGAMGLVLGLRALGSGVSTGRNGFQARSAVRRLAYPALLGMLFLLLVFPYLYQVRQQTGAWTVSQKVGAHFATAAGLAEGSMQRFDRETWGLDGDGHEVLFFSAETASASAAPYILADPVGYLRVIYGNTLNLFALLVSPRLLPFFVLPFIGLALFARAWSRRRAWDELFLAATLLPGLSFVLFFVSERYISPLAPTLFIWFGHGLILAGKWLRRTWHELFSPHASTRRSPELVRGMAQSRGAVLLWAPLVLLALFFLAYTPRQVAGATNPGSTRAAHTLAAQALAPHLQPGEIVMSRYVSIAFHAGAEWIPTPAASLQQVLAYAQRKGACYWAIDAFEARSLRPQFGELMETAAGARPDLPLQFLAEVDDGRGPVVLYRLNSCAPSAQPP